MTNETSEPKKTGHGTLLWIGVALAVVLALLAVLLVSKYLPEQAIEGSQLLNFLGIVIGAVALVATVGFLVLAFPIWSELGAIAEERSEIAKDRSETLELQHQVKTMMRDLENDTLELRQKFETTIAELNAPYSRYTGIFESIQLFSTVIRYIGTPLWEDPDHGEGSAAETESERIERHVSLVQQLMAALAVEPKLKTSLYLSFLRDAIGHLRASDDEIFFEFLETRLAVVHPSEEKDLEVYKHALAKFQVLRGEAVTWRRSQKPTGLE